MKNGVRFSGFGELRGLLSGRRYAVDRNGNAEGILLPFFWLSTNSLSEVLLHRTWGAAYQREIEEWVELIGISLGCGRGKKRELGFVTLELIGYSFGDKNESKKVFTKSTCM
ncbi:hypothetical protein TNIN_138821 [Trichonephila inaurata madagascariensis]|uniref:Uncharacterized protein n=1 Tax=Trichonephila inaurata madagascariensis TaxID=2747483 RepID=A0A8X6WQC0_9ARAC|nr:hypothetical protein TNIN_138821 [Trichonephila inaurata madagascariensis]